MHKSSIPYLIVAVCLCVILSTSVFAETEPNDSPGTASPLALNSTDGGYMNENDPVDWWVVTTTVDGKLYIETNSDASYLDVDLGIYDAGGRNQIASYGLSVGNKETTQHDGLLPGTYYVRANMAGGKGGTNYSIQCIFTPAGLQNDPEVNDSSAIAVLFNPNSSRTGHLGFYGEGYTDGYDWWKVTITFDGSLVVNTVSDSSLDIDLHMFDQNGITQIASYDTSIGIREATHHYNLTQGTYYIRATRYSGRGSYTISNIFAPTGLAIDPEPNDSVQSASTLAVNNSTTGHLGYFKIGAYDIYDWWKVSMPDDGDLIVRTLSDPTLEIDLHMYDQDGISQIASYDTSWGIHESTHYYGLKAGTYFVRALGYNSGYCNSYGSYQISSPYAAALFANDPEPNDSLLIAGSISLNTEINGHLGFYGNGARDQYDYYTFTLPAGWDTLFIRTDSKTTIDIDLTLFSDAGLPIIFSGASGTVEVLAYASPAAGTYSVQLRGYAGGYGSYGLIVSNVRPNTPMVSVEDQKSASVVPESFSLSQNYPNPFNPTTTIEYQIPPSPFSKKGERGGFVTLRVYDVLGREVATLVNEMKPAGTYTITWNAANMPSGIYFYRLVSDKFTAVKKLMLIK